MSIATTELSVVEVYSAFNRLVRERRLVEREYRELLIDLEELFSMRYTLLPLSSDVMKLARRILERHPLRAYDSVHLASAISANNELVAMGSSPLTFLSADHRLFNAATAEGLTIFDPSTAP